MGLLKWIARRGAVGGTARWAAKSYLFFRHRHPDTGEFSDNDIFRLMIVTRYEVLPDADAQQHLLSIANGLTGLRDLVVAILTTEASFTENTVSNQEMMLDVIEEELERNGMPREVICGCGRKTENACRRPQCQR